MKKSLKKALIMLLSVAMVFTYMAMPVYADDLTDVTGAEAIESEGEGTVYTDDEIQFSFEGFDFSLVSCNKVTVTDAGSFAEIKLQFPDGCGIERISQSAAVPTDTSNDLQFESDSQLIATVSVPVTLGEETSLFVLDDSYGEWWQVKFTVSVSEPQPEPIDLVRAAIQGLSDDPTTYTASDKASVEAIWTDFKALSEEDQAILDEEASYTGSSQPLGRILEGALWAVWSYETDDTTTLAEGTYTTTTEPAVSSQSSKGKSTSSRTRNWWVESVDVSSDGHATAYIYVTSGAATASKLTSYPSVWVGGETVNIDENNNYAIPIDLNGVTYFGGISSSMGAPIMYSMTTEIDESFTPQPEQIDLTITNITTMFKAVSAYLIEEEGQEYLVMALSGTGYTELFKGTYEQAVANGDGTAENGNNSWIHGYTNDDGKMEFKIPLNAEDTYVPIVSVSKSYYDKYINNINSIERSYYPRQFTLNRDEKTLVTDDYHYNQELVVTNNVARFSVSGAALNTVGGPNSNGYKSSMDLTMGSTSFDEAYVGTKEEAAAATETITIGEGNVFEIPVRWVETFGSPETMKTLIGEPFVMSFHSVKNDSWYERMFKISEVEGTLVINQVVEPAEVTFTLSNKGSFVTGKDGKIVIDRPVTVSDIDKDGHLTYDEALVAAHDAYYEGGAEAGYSAGASFTNLIWGVSSTNNLFFINGEGLPNGVTADEVKAGDSLYASINADDAYYADWYTKFSESDIEATSADDITVTLTGHLGMAYTDEDKQFVPLEGIQIGVWKDGAFEAIDGAVTDKDGKATFRMAAGEYLLTAQGTVDGVVTDWALQCDETLYGTTGYVKYGDEYDSGFAVGYTEKDYGNGPYPIDEVKWVDWSDWFAEGEDFEGYLLYSNQFIAGCPIMAPYANLTVTKTTIPADYSAVDTALAKVPKDLSIYTEETAKDVTDAVNAVDRTKMADEQEVVDAMAQAIDIAVANLKYDFTRATVAEIKDQTYTGKVITPNVTVNFGDAELIKDTDYEVLYQNNTNVGTATVTITGINDYKGTKTATFTINQAAQTITAKAGASAVSVGKTTKITVTGAMEKVTYKSSNEKIATVTTKGVVKALKVGTVKITVTSGGNNYKKVSKTVTIKVVPAATTKLTAANQATGIKLTWKKVTGATGYKVYRGSTLIKTITSGSTLTYTDKKANTNGKKYTYKIVATASTGASKLSKSVTAYRVSRPAISSAKNSAAKKMTVKWGKNSKATGYQIQYSTSKSFSSYKSTTVTKNSTVSKTIGSLKKGKTYYVRVRSYKTVSGKKYYSAWSVVKSVKITK